MFESIPSSQGKQTQGLICSILLGVCLVISQSVWAEYYTYDGSNLSYHSEGSPTGKVDYWAVYYFHKGVPSTNPTFAWGKDIDHSASGVAQNVLQAQKFEKTYEKWCGCSWGPSTYFNPLYPVAVINDNWEGAHADNFRFNNVALIRFHWIADEILAILQRINKACDLADQRRIVPEWKGPLADFFRAMHRSLDQFQSIRAEVGGMGNQALRNLFKSLDSIENDVNQASRSADTVIAMLNNNHEAPSDAPVVDCDTQRDNCFLERHARGLERGLTGNSPCWDQYNMCKRQQRR